METKELQAQIVAAVEARGYLDGFTETQLAARQVAKLVEELAELSAVVWQDRAGSRPWELALADCAVAARAAFDNREEWDNASLAPFSAVRELADIVVVCCCLAHALGIKDVMALALDKAEADIKRGVRQMKT